MATLEQVEKLRERANVSFEEAKAALEASNDDLLDAMIFLEKQGKIREPQGGGYYSNGAGAPDNGGTEFAGGKTYNGDSFGDMLKRFGRFCVKIINKGNNNFLDVKRNGELLFSCPITLLVLLFICFFWVITPLVIIGMFCGYRYSIRGAELGKEAVNKAIDDAYDVIDDLKKNINEKHEGMENQGEQ